MINLTASECKQVTALRYNNQSHQAVAWTNVALNTLPNEYYEDTKKNIVSLSYENQFQSIAMNSYRASHNKSLNSDEDHTPILGSATFDFLKIRNKFLIQNKTFDKNDNVKIIINLLQNDFRILQRLCNFNVDHEDFFNGIDSIDLQETTLLIDHYNNIVHLNYLESSGKGIYIKTNDFINIIQAWKACLQQEFPHVGLIQCLNTQYQVIPFPTKEIMDEYLHDHQVQG